jgi:hypothetical protein
MWLWLLLLVCLSSDATTPFLTPAHVQMCGRIRFCEKSRRRHDLFTVQQNNPTFFRLLS